MLDRAGAADMAVDRHIVGRVGKNHFCPLAIHQRCHDIAIECAAADQSMLPKLPDIARPATRWAVCRWKQVVCRIAGLFRIEPFDQAVDLGDREAGQTNVEVEIDRQQSLEFFGQDLVIPAGIEGELVVGKHIGSLFLLVTYARAGRRAPRPCRELRRLDPAVAGEDHIRRDR